MTKDLPETVTSYDLLKTFAVIIMVIDHVGYYFYPDNEWFRAVGRIGFPIWFYLVGHASGRDITWKLLGGACLLLALNFVVGMPLLPLNALFTIIFLRLAIDYIMGPLKKVPALLWPVLLVMTVLILPTNYAFEYGTQAFLFAMFGYMVRHKDELRFSHGDLQFYMISIAAIFLAFQWLAFTFALDQFVVMAIGTLAVCITLQDFRPTTYPRLDHHLAPPAKWFLRFCGNRTLEIYVAHQALFKILVLAYGFAGYEFLSFKLLAE